MPHIEAAMSKPFRALVDYAGGVAELARQLGVHEATIWRWGTGRVVPSAIVRGAVATWAETRGLAAPEWGVKGVVPTRAAKTKGWVVRNKRGSYATDESGERFSTSAADAFRWGQTAEASARLLAQKIEGTAEWK